LEAAETPNATTGRFARRSTLLAWHLEDPVSQEERKLNQRIYSNYQQNRNPFIDHPA
jgi:endonuclease I